MPGDEAAYQRYEVDSGPLSVLKIKTLFGANYFSGGPVVVVRLDLGDLDEVFTNQIPGFAAQLAQTLPSLEQHHCSVGRDGGFFERVRAGTLLGHVAEHVAIELQTLAGMDVGYGKTRSTRTPGVYNVVFRFLDDHVGVYAAKAAVNLLNALLRGDAASFDVRQAVATLVQIRESRLLGPSTQAIVEAAKHRGAPCLRLDEYNLLQLGTGRHRKRIRATITSDTSLIAVELAADKHLATRVLAEAGVPVPEQLMTDDVAAVLAFAARLQRPIVIKPRHGQKGMGTSLALRTEEEIVRAATLALSLDEWILAQPFLEGHFYRLLLIDFELVAAARMTPPAISGDGRQTIEQLVAALNEEPGREIGDKGRLSRVEIDEVTTRILAERGYTPQTVLPAGEVLRLKISPSLSQGGAAFDVTDEVHPENRMLAERAARAINLNVAGIDLIAENIGISLLEGRGAVSAVSAAPGFRGHLMPVAGKPRDVAEHVVQMLFPGDLRPGVPLVAVTGTRGKTAAVRLLRHALHIAGYTVGATSSEGLFIDDATLARGPMTGLTHVGMVLKDPTIDCAVFEVPVEAILDEGLGYEAADVGIVLNVYDEGKVYDEAKRLEDVAYAKSVVAEEVAPEGYALLNADDELVIEMIARVRAHPVLFSRRYDNERVREHVAEGGRAAVVDGRYVTILDGRERIDLVHLDDVPAAACRGDAVDTIIAVCAALFSLGVSVDTIRRSFAQLPQQ